MEKHIEKEYKVLLTKEQFETLCNQFNDLKFVSQTNTYYDTKDFVIRNKKGAMRIREKNNKYIFTLKMKDKNIDGLYECECEVRENSVHALYSDEIQSLLKSYDIDGELIPLTTLTTRRAVINTGKAEICFDISTYNGITDYEIEYEYLIPHDGLLEFQSLLDIVHIKYRKNCISKIQRALYSIK